MKLRRASIPILSLLTLAAPLAVALDFSFEGPRFNFLLAGGLPVPAGGDLKLLFPLGVSPLSVSLFLGAGYQDRYLLRDAATGDPIAAQNEDNEGSVYAPGRNAFHSPNAQWDLGLVAALPPGDGRLLAFAYWRGRLDANLNDLPTLVFRDVQGLFGNSLFVGAAWDDVRTDGRRVKAGRFAEASAEWAPPGLASAEVDYLRLDLQCRAFVPLFTRGDGDLNLVSSYLALLAQADWTTGSAMPLHVFQYFGGRAARKGLGGSVRGYPSQAWDAAFKAVANMEVRVLGPAFFGLPWAMPLAYGFLDAGLYSGLPGAGADRASAAGFVASTGGGIALNLLDFAQAGFMAGILLPGDDPLYPVYLPGGEKSFFSIEFLLHF
ncbi:MAG: hypothetical protein Q8M76_18805 [Spirochaetaceae bacterium]|nr:hypothetical protein [Spirochaetaceae bacterium]